MTPFRKLLLYGFITAALWMVMVYFGFLPAFLFFVLIIFMLIYIILGAIYIQRNFFLSSINSLADIGISPEEKKIMLSFDDGIHPENTPKVLDLLKEKNIKAFFFLIGKETEHRQAILKQMMEDGHGIGNHSYSHDFWFDMKSSKQMLHDLQHCSSILQQTTEEVITYCRPPYGVTNPNLAKAIRLSGMHSVGWNVRSMDTVAKSKEMLLERLKRKTKANSIILLHDRCTITVEVLTEYIDYCLLEGYTFVTL